MSYVIYAGSRTHLVELNRVRALLLSAGRPVTLLGAQGILSEEAVEAAPDAPRMKLLAAWRRYFRGIDATALIVAEDGIGGNLAAVRAAREHGVPVFIVPYEYSGLKSRLNYVVRHVPQPPSFVANLFRFFLPHWVKRVNGRAYLRLRPRSILSYELAGLRPRNAWTVHGGDADILLSESEAMTQHYRREGIRPEKIREVGALALDELAARLGAKKGTGTRILCAFPPDYSATYTMRDHASYMSMVHAWADVARAHGDVVFQAHPAARESLAGSGLPLDKRDIVDLIAECDVLVTTTSSVIRLAIAAGKRVVNYDCYGFNYTHYHGAENCETVDNFVDFRHAVARVARAPLAQPVERWGILDGKAGERMLKVMDAVIEETRAARQSLERGRTAGRSART